MEYSITSLYKIDENCPYCGSPIELILLDKKKEGKYHYFRCSNTNYCKSFATAEWKGNQWVLRSEMADQELTQLRKNILNIIGTVCSTVSKGRIRDNKRLYTKDILHAHIKYQFPTWPDTRNIYKLTKAEAKTLLGNLKNYYGPFIIYGERDLYYASPYFKINKMVR